MQNAKPIPTADRAPLPSFTPVPRQHQRHDGWTDDRQRAFIEALADTGSVKAAARTVGMSSEGAYYLRRQAGAESFRDAWEAALAAGVRTLTDVAIDRALHGVAVPVFWRGEQVGEKRKFNDRLLMFILKHHIPDRYGTASLPGGTKHPDTIAREAGPGCRTCIERAALEGHAKLPEEVEKELMAWLARVLDMYAKKIGSERRLRLSGNTVGADYTLRQLTHLELILDLGGVSTDTVAMLSTRLDANGRPIELYASPMSEMLDEARRKQWAADGEPARPPLSFPETLPSVPTWGGPTIFDRSKARDAAQAAMAKAQKQWEAAAREDSWAEWLARKTHDR